MAFSVINDCVPNLHPTPRPSFIIKLTITSSFIPAKSTRRVERTKRKTTKRREEEKRGDLANERGTKTAAGESNEVLTPINSRVGVEEQVRKQWQQSRLRGVDLGVGLLGGREEKLSPSTSRSPELNFPLIFLGNVEARMITF